MTLEKWIVAPGESRVIDAELVRAVKIGLIGGQIDVIGHDEPTARVEVHSVSGKDLKISIDGDRLEIDHPQLRWDNFIEVFSHFRGSAKAEISLVVPRDVALTFGVVSASGLLSGLRTDAKVSTVSGEIVVDGVVGDLEINGVNGELTVRGHEGSINAHTVTGDIVATGTLRRFSSDSVSGNVFLDLDGAPHEIAVNTVSGDLTVRLDDTLGSRYRINTVSGALRIDGGTHKGTFGKGFTGSYGNLDGVWVDIAANSVSGDVSIIRRPAAASTAAPTEIPVEDAPIEDLPVHDLSDDAANDDPTPPDVRIDDTPTDGGPTDPEGDRS